MIENIHQTQKRVLWESYGNESWTLED